MGCRGRRSRPSALLRVRGARLRRRLQVSGDAPLLRLQRLRHPRAVAGEVLANALEFTAPGAAFEAEQLLARLVGQLDARQVQVFRRSEEHTSELQSLMRNSYDVFCLKKKKKP